jgi:hypothetical protein
MNPDTKMFEMMTKEKKQEVLKELFTGNPKLDGARLANEGWTLFEYGERVEIKGNQFYVRKVTKKDLILRPVGQQEVKE